MTIKPQVGCLGEVEWVARVVDVDDDTGWVLQILYIEAGMSKRCHAEDAARTVARGLSIGVLWEDVAP